MSQQPGEQPAPRVHPLVATLAAYSWRLIAIGVVALAVLWLLGALRLVLIPIVVALFVVRGLSPVAGWLRRHRWRPGFAAMGALVAGLVIVGAIGTAVVPSVASEFGSVGPTITEAIDDIEDWLVDDSPFDVSRESIDRLRERTGERFDELLRESDGQVLDSATLAAEVVTGLLLVLLLTFFMLRDGRRFVDWAIGLAPSRRHEALHRGAERGWATLGGYLKGAALLGIVEAIAIGLALWLAGGSLVAPVMILTFVAAFVPIAGAMVAGVVAVLVALVTGGVTTAVIVAIVALLVQQFDNDLLAPIVYGRALALHPVVILLSVVAGSALFGIAGTMLAVPVVAVSINVAKELSAREA